METKNKFDVDFSDAASLGVKAQAQIEKIRKGTMVRLLRIHTLTNLDYDESRRQIQPVMEFILRFMKATAEMYEPRNEKMQLLIGQIDLCVAQLELNADLKIHLLNLEEEVYKASGIEINEQ